jgi:class 3 adenylate cyclase/tetratricopeptide (TPR) repeat protein
MPSQFIPEDIDMVRKGQQLFSGSLLFVDITGFTELSEKLSRQGKAGTEELTDLLNSYFDRLLGIVREHSGVVLGFAGDSVTVRFGDPDVSFSCARDLMLGIRDFRSVSTSQGEFSLGAKIVVANGQWQEFVVGDARKADLVLAGKLVSGIAVREDATSVGEIAVIHGPSSVTAVDYTSPPVPDEAFLVTRGEVPGEHRAVSVMFLDVSRPPGVDPPYSVLQELYLGVLDIVSVRGGVIHSLDSIHRDGCRILVLFGAPVSYGNDSFRSELAGFDMNVLMREFGALETRLGVGLGYVYAGTTGNDWRKQYTVIGDTVNTVARLAASLDPGQWAVAHDLAEATRDLVEFEELPPVRVKGKTEPLERFSPTGIRKARSFRFGFVGREAELASLSGLLGPGGLALVTGDAGSGKTRLLGEFSRRASESGVRVLQGVAVEHGQAYPLFGSMVASLCGMEPLDAPPARRQKLSSYLAGLGVPDLARREVFLGRMLFSLDYPPSRYDDMDPALRRENLLEALRLLVEAQGAPLCLVLEDVHLSRSEELDLLASLARVLLLSGQRITLVVSRRPDDRELVLGEGLEPVPMTLGGLESSAASSLVSEILAGRELSPDVAALVAGKSGGNPFCLVQFILYLVEKELIAEGPSCWEKTPAFRDDALPENVFSMIMARIDRLEEAAKEALRVASVIGMEFTEEVVERVLEREVHSDLDSSTALGLTYLASVAELEFIFSHLLIKDVTYDSILRRRRRKLHGDVGRILEGIAAGSGSDISPVLAYHFGEAREWPEAVRYLMLSGKRAAEEYRNEEAIEDYSGAVSIIVEHLPDMTRELRVCYLGLARLQDTVGDYDNAIASYRKQLEFLDEPLERAVALENIANIHFTRGELDTADSMVEEIEGMLVEGEPGHDALIIRMCNFRAWSYGVQGELDKARAVSEKGLELALKLPLDTPGNLKTLGHTCNTVATVHYAASDYEDALSYYRKALEMAKELKGPREIAVTMGNIGLVYQCMGRLREAVQAIEQQMEVSREMGDRLIMASSHSELASTCKALGEYRRALSHAVSCMEISQALNSTHDLQIALGYISDINIALGDLDEAQEYAERALEMSTGPGYERESRIDYSLLGRLSLLRGDPDSAVEHFHAGIEVCRKIGDREILPQSLRWLAEAELARGNTGAAAEHLEEAMAITTETGSRIIQSEVKIGLGLLRNALGEHEEAVAVLEEALGTFEELELRPWQAEALRALSRVLSAMEGREDEAASRLSRAEELDREMKL